MIRSAAGPASALGGTTSSTPAVRCCLRARTVRDRAPRGPFERGLHLRPPRAPLPRGRRRCGGEARSPPQTLGYRATLSPI